MIWVQIVTDFVMMAKEAEIAVHVQQDIPSLNRHAFHVQLRLFLN